MDSRVFDSDVQQPARTAKPGSDNPDRAKQPGQEEEDAGSRG